MAKKWTELTEEEKEQRRIKRRAWAAANPDKVKAQRERALKKFMATKYIDNYEEYKKWHDAWVERNKQHVRDYQREYHRMYREKRKAELKEYRKKWNAENREKLNAQKRERYHKQKQAAQEATPVVEQQD